MTTTHRKCRMCAKPVSRWNKTGLCKPCHSLDPAAREKQREASAAFNRSERMRDMLAVGTRMRELARVKAEALTPLQRTKGLTPETRKRQMITRTERQLAQVPPDQRKLYIRLTRRSPRLSADEALQVCLEQEKIDLARFRRALPVKEPEPC